MGEKFKREGTYVCLWLIHVDAWEKPRQYCKAIILQLKIFKKKESSFQRKGCGVSELRSHMPQGNYNY